MPRATVEFSQSHGAPRRRKVTMGLYDRDYYRSDPRTSAGWLGGTGSVVKWLIAVNVAVFVLQLLTLRANGGGLTDWLELKPDRVVRHFEVWRLLTYAFCHHPHEVWHI